MINRKVFKDQDLVFTVKNILKDNGYQELFAINRARVPLVKFVCPFIEVRQAIEGQETTLTPLTHISGDTRLLLSFIRC